MSPTPFYIYIEVYFRVCVTVLLMLSLDSSVILSCWHPEHPVLLEAGAGGDIFCMRA